MGHGHWDLQDMEEIF